MKLLPAELHRFVYRGSHIEAGIYEHQSYRHYVRFTLDSGDDLTGGDDLKSRFVDEVHSAAVG